jgi:hypothetical protein
MDELSFITQAKLGADAPYRHEPTLTKADTARALDYDRALENDSFRGILALATASLVNAAFFGALESSRLDAYTPSGEVTIAEVELIEQQPSPTVVARL